MSGPRAKISPRVVAIDESPRHKTAQALAEAAVALFAEQGFNATTRDIAARLGVTQALIYKYFAGKDALIDAALAIGLANRWESAWDSILGDRAVPLADRLKRFYGLYIGGMSAERSRLWMYATLAGIDLPKRYAFPTTERILKPIIAALREEFGMPDFTTRPMTKGERELAMAFHGGLLLLLQRKNFYRIELPAGLNEIIAMHVDLFLGGARAALDRLAGASDTLKAPHAD